MKRAVVSAVTLVAAYTLTAGTAVALFLPKTQLQNIAIKTANLALQVSFQATDPPTQFFPSLNMGGPGNLVPGVESPIAQEFWINNASTGSPGQGLMKLVGRMQGGGGDWEALKNVVELQVEAVKYHEKSPWYTLAAWEGGQELPGGSLSESQSRRYRFVYRLPTAYVSDPDGDGPLAAGSTIGNELMGKAVTGATFVVEGSLQ